MGGYPGNSPAQRRPAAARNTEPIAIVGGIAPFPQAKPELTTARARWWAIAAAWLLLILWLTLRSAPDQAMRVADLPWYCVLCGEAGVADVLLNVLLFAPLGIAARALQLPRWRVFAVAVVLTIAIETTQWFLLVGRDGSLGDVLANSAGAVLGWLAYSPLCRMARPTRALARRGTWMVFAVATLVWFTTGFGLQPSLSEATPWVGQVQHHWPGHDAFAGTIEWVDINGVAVPNDPIASPLPPHDTVALHIALTRSGAPLPRRRASMVRIVDANGHPQVAITASGADVVTEMQLRASRWGFHTPEWMYHGAMMVPVRQRWQVTARWTPARVELATADSAGAHAVLRSHPLSIALGWVFVHPFVTIVGSNVHLWNYLWVAEWFGLLGWFSGVLGWRAVGIAALAQLLVLVVAASVTGAPWHPDELLAAMLACGLTATVARRRSAAPPSRGLPATATISSG